MQDWEHNPNQLWEITIGNYFKNICVGGGRNWHLAANHLSAFILDCTKFMMLHFYFETEYSCFFFSAKLNVWHTKFGLIWSAPLCTLSLLTVLLSWGGLQTDVCYHLLLLTCQHQASHGGVICQRFTSAPHSASALINQQESLVQRQIVFVGLYTKKLEVLSPGITLWVLAMVFRFL